MGLAPNGQPQMVPVEGVLRVISTLATEAAMEVNADSSEADPELPPYLLNEAGELAADPADPQSRAARCLELLREAAVERDLALEALAHELAEATDDSEDLSTWGL
jgi:hypothetical protein